MKKKILLGLLAALSSLNAMASEFLSSGDGGDQKSTHKMTFTLELEMNQVKQKLVLEGELNQIINYQKAEHISIYDVSRPATLPKNFGPFERIYDLRLRGENLTGSLPSDITDLQTLKYFSILYTSLSGNLPLDLGKLSNIEQLAFSHNRLTGTLPKSLGDLSKVFWLGFEQNQLEGLIPEEIGKLSELRTLDLEGNNFCGPIPKTLFNLEKLQTFNISHNPFVSMKIDEVINDENVSQFYLIKKNFPDNRFFQNGYFSFQNTAIFGRISDDILKNYDIQVRGTFVNQEDILEQVYQIYTNAYDTYDRKKESYDNVAAKKLRALYESFAEDKKEHFVSEENFLDISKGFFDGYRKGRKTTPVMKG